MDLDIFKRIEVKDVFDMCLIRCRTSSRSVVHQNTFRSKIKHCFGKKAPPLTMDDDEPNNT